jgi:hypothetical protein
MYLTGLRQTIDDICIMAMWFERGRSFALGGWIERNTLPPPNKRWWGNGAGKFRDAWDAGWKRGVEERRTRLALGRDPDPLGAILRIPIPKTADEWV